MEFFAPFFQGKDIKRLNALKNLQDTLGIFNDCAVQQEALAGKLDDLKERSGNRKLEIAKSLGALLTVLDRRQREAREQVVTRHPARQHDLPRFRHLPVADEELALAA